jgi:hypothetical protein
MVASETFESSLPNEVRYPEIVIPFTPDIIEKLRVRILIASGVFSRTAIAQQLKNEKENDVISKFVTTKVIKNRKINTDFIVGSLEKQQMESTYGISPRAMIKVDFLDFLIGIFDLDARIEEIHELAKTGDDGAEKMFTNISNIFENDDILLALSEDLESGKVSEDQTKSYERAIQAQKTVLIAVNQSRLTH